MRFAHWPALLLIAVLGCSGPVEEPPPPTTTTTTLELTNKELISLEGTPGSTPALAHAVEPASSPVAGVPGTPGPSPAFGPEDASVRVYVFTDFQCPVCPRVVEPLKHLARAYPNDVRVVLKNNALAMHASAASAAAAGLAAFRQGKFWEYHDRLFSSRQLDEQSLVAHAQALGLDVARFQHDMADEAVIAQVVYESGLATKIELASTPGFVVNGDVQTGWGSYMGLASQVKRELGRAQSVAASGVPPARVAYEATRQAGPKGETLATGLFAGQ